MMPENPSIKVQHLYGSAVEGEAIVSEEGFSPRYDLNRWTGEITKPGHKLEGLSIKDKILFFPTAKGGVAAGWAFFDIKDKEIAPKALVFGVTNPVMVQGAVFAGMTIVSGLSKDPSSCFQTGDTVRIVPGRMLIERV